jgi:hypothetical protein
MSGSVLKLLPTLSQQNSRQHAKVGMLNRPQAKPAEAPLPLRAVFALECGIRAAVIVIALRAGYAAQRRQRDRGGKHSLPKPAFHRPPPVLQMERNYSFLLGRYPPIRPLRQRMARVRCDYGQFLAIG